MVYRSILRLLSGSNDASIQCEGKLQCAAPPPRAHVYVPCQLCLLSCANSGLRAEARALCSLSLRFALLINPFWTLIGFDAVHTFSYFLPPPPFNCEK